LTKYAPKQSTSQVQQASVSSDLLAWYDRHARDLPWRYKDGAKADPYRVWLSEVMLQQTTVPTVMEYFAFFTNKWPTVHDLAKAELDEVLHAWQGLGYYARARNLHKCAQVVSVELGGVFPNSQEELIKLPGVGSYTSAAISTIAFGNRAVAVDGNIERVFSRILNLETPLPQLKVEIVPKIEVFLPETRVGDYTQALMDLGSSVCTPKKPKCLICPLSKHCQANKLGVAESLPRRMKKSAKPVREALFYWIRDKKDRVLLERRPARGLLGGMIGLPSSEWKKLDKETFDLGHERKQLEKSGGGVTITQHKFEHVFTHFRLLGHIGKCRIHDGDAVIDNMFIEEDRERFFWFDANKLDQQALPTCMKKAVKAANQQSS